MPDLRELTEAWLRANGYDGLCYSDFECGCSVDDLMPCDHPNQRCVAGFEGPCLDGEGDFGIYETKEAAEAAKKENSND